MRKKLLAVFIIGMMLVLAGCGKGDTDKAGVQEDDTSESGVSEEVQKSLYDQGLDMIATLDALLQSEHYIEITIGSTIEEIKEVVEEVRNGDYTEPTAVYRIEVLEDYLNMIYAMSHMEMPKLSEEVEEQLTCSAFLAVPNRINGMENDYALAAASILRVTKTFVSDELEESCYYIYVYENAYPVMVSFQKGEGGAVSASASFLFVEDMMGADGETVRDLMENSYFYGGCEIEEV